MRNRKFKVGELQLKDKLVYIGRVAKVVKGGRRFSFTSVIVVGDGSGHVGIGLGKAKDVSSSVQKAVSQAKRNLINVKLKNTTIAHEVHSTFGAAEVFLKPAPKGSGIIAGGAVRVVLELVGVKDVSAKMLGSNNRSSNLKCALEALKKLKS